MICRDCNSTNISPNGYTSAGDMAILIWNYLERCESFIELTQAYSGLSIVLHEALCSCTDELVKRIKDENEDQ